MATSRPQLQGNAASDNWTWRNTATWSLCLLALWLGLLALSQTGDSARVAAEVTASRMTDTVMVCLDGQIAYEGDSTFDRLTGRLFSSGHFMCTEWRMREALKAKR